MGNNNSSASAGGGDTGGGSSIDASSSGSTSSSSGGTPAQATRAPLIKFATKFFAADLAALPSPSGKTIAITGCTSGTGLALAIGVASRGARVIMLNRPSERARAALAEVQRAAGAIAGGDAAGANAAGDDAAGANYSAGDATAATATSEAVFHVDCDLQSFASTRAAAEQLLAEGLLIGASPPSTPPEAGVNRQSCPGCTPHAACQLHTRPQHQLHSGHAHTRFESEVVPPTHRPCNNITHTRRPDVLVNNAGVMALPDVVTDDGYDVQMQTNHLSHFLLTSLLWPLCVRVSSTGANNHVAVRGE